MALRQKYNHPGDPALDAIAQALGNTNADVVNLAVHQFARVDLHHVDQLCRRVGDLHIAVASRGGEPEVDLGPQLRML